MEAVLPEPVAHIFSGSKLGPRKPHAPDVIPNVGDESPRTSTACKAAQKMTRHADTQTCTHLNQIMRQMRKKKHVSTATINSPIAKPKLLRIADIGQVGAKNANSPWAPDG